MNSFFPQPGRQVLEAQLGGAKYVERLLSYIQVQGSDDCWKWKMGKDAAGYGAFRSAFKTVKAHRMVATLCLSCVELTSEQHVMHTCDNPACCNPQHLKIATHTENMRDMFSKKRRESAKGVRQGHSKLTESQVLEIRKRHRAGSRRKGERTSDLAKEFGITRHTVNAIARRESWNHL